MQPLPFVIDPLASLRPNGPNARREGNAFVGGKLTTLKWTPQDFANAPDGALPTGESGSQWTYGDLKAGFDQADLVLDETFHTRRRAISPSKRARRWRTGRTASCTCTDPRRA